MDVHLATAMTCTRAGGPKVGPDTAFNELFDGVDDLIKRVADSENPEIRKIRAKVHASLAGAKTAWEDAWEDGARAHDHTHDDEGFPDEDDNQAFGVALLVGMGLGMIMSIQP